MLLSELKKIALFSALLYSIAIFVSSSAYSKTLEDILLLKREAYANIKVDPDEPLYARVRPMPSAALSSLIQGDKSIGIAQAAHYKNHILDAQEKALVQSYLARLPERYKKILADKLTGIYFLDNFAGGGITNWYVDQDNNVYYDITLNSALLDATLAEWMTYRANSFFEQGDYYLTITTERAVSAVLYGLLHEASHVVDFELTVTPFLDDWFVQLKKQTKGASFLEKQFSQLKKNNKSATAFTKDVWLDVKKPIRHYRFVQHRHLNAYQIFTEKGVLGNWQLPRMFEALQKTPFVSFYSLTAWYEDFADFFTYYHVNEVEGNTIRLFLHKGDKPYLEYQPFENDLVQKRTPLMKHYYSPQPGSCCDNN